MRWQRWLLAALLLATPRASAPPRRLAAPTEGESGKADRKQWFVQMHRAPPGVDWRRIERDNGLAQMRKRTEVERGARVALAPSGRWIERGSDNQSGRMVTARPSTDGIALYAGSALGGLWKGGLDGSGWTPLGDNLFGGVHWLVPMANGSGPDALLVATRDGTVHRSEDEGLTWDAPSGLPEDLGSIRRLVRASDGPLYLYASDAPSSYRVYRSADEGRSFAEILALGAAAGDLWVSRTGASTELYVTDGDAMWVSADGGANFVERGRIGAGGDWAEMCGSEAGAPTLYVAVHVDAWNTTLYRSDDGGANWSAASTLDDYFGGGWAALEASTRDPLLVVHGGVEAHVSRDGGADFTMFNPWRDYYDDPATRLHADMQRFDVIPDGAGNETWYISTDGGVYDSADGFATVRNLALRGLRVSMYYDTLTSSADPAHVAAGTQDQGWQYAADAAWEGEGVFDFEQLQAGDFAHLSSSDGTHAYLYGVYPGWVLVSKGEDDPRVLIVDFPEVEGRYAWLPPLVADPLDPTAFFLGTSALTHHVKDGPTWNAEDWSDQDFATEEGEYVGAFTFSPVDPERAYLATSLGRVWVSDDRGVSWTASAMGSEGPDGHWFYGGAMVASRTDRDTAWVGGSGYGTPAVWRTDDGGIVWADYSQGLPSTMVYDLAESPDGSGVLYAATETAAYARGPGDDTWVDITGTDAPITTYWTVEAVGAANTMRFGTYGRGIWDYVLPASADGDDTGVDEETPPPSTPSAVKDCGCAGTGSAGALFLVGLVGVARRSWVSCRS